MTATAETTASTSCGSNPAPAGVSLDLVLGERDATRCSGCGRLLPALERPAFEVETIDGDTLCMVCVDKMHRPLRTAVLLLDTIVNAISHGDRQQAADAIGAVINGVEMLKETAPKIPYARPVRHQPRRNPRSRRR